MKPLFIASLLLASLALSIPSIVPPHLTIPNSYAVSSLQGFSPKNYNDGKQYGNGVYFAPHDITIYEQESEKSPIVEQFHWDKANAEMFSLTSTKTNRPIPIRNVFISFYP